MASIDFEDVKIEKSKALNCFQTIGFFFRVVEISVALLFFCWLFTCLPSVTKISGDFLRRLACVVSSPMFMFFLGNSIVVALLTTKSSVFSSACGDGRAETDIYDAFLISVENRVNSSDGDLTEEIIVYDDKQMITAVETNSTSNSDSNSNSNSTVTREDHDSKEDLHSVTEAANDHPAKVYRRTKSEVSMKQSQQMVTKPSLRRSETERCRKIVETCEDLPMDENFPEDHMSNEEFQKTIEAFIAKQLIFRRRESLAVVIHNKI